MHAMQIFRGTALSRVVQRVPNRRFSSIIQKYEFRFAIRRHDNHRSFHVACKLSQSKVNLQGQQQEDPVAGKSLEWPDPIWLRDACNCELCLDPSSKQKRFQTSDIPLDIDFLHKEVGPDGLLTVTWSNDIQGFGNDHVSKYSKGFIWPTDNAPQKEKTLSSTKKCYWDKDLIEKSIKFIDFDHYMSQDSVVYDVLNQLRIYGIVFLRNVPESEKAIEEIAGRVGPLKNTFYGLTWDVKSVPAAKNVAYTHQYLGLHMDLLYMDDPPALQLLHCLKNTCEGGTSMFCDSWHAASLLRKRDLETFKGLLRQRTTFQYDNAGQQYHQKRLLIGLDRKRRVIESVYWSPPFQAPFALPRGTDNEKTRKGMLAFRSYAKALKQFAAILESKEQIYEYRIKEGECVIFANKRVLHARTAFDISSGERWLKGAYIDRDVWHSRHVVLERMFGHPVAPVPEDDASTSISS